MSKQKQRLSEIWTYFSQSDAEHAKCNLCNNQYSRKGRSTSSLRNHLKCMHKNEYNEIEKREKVLKTDQLASSSQHITKADLKVKQETLVAFVEKRKHWDDNNAKSVAVDNLIGEMIALEDLPFSFVESLGFGRLVKQLCPSYNLKGRQYFTSYICEKLYGKVENKILDLIKSFEKMSFTTDIWSDSASGVSLLSFTCHGITENFERKLAVLKSEVFSESRHTGENIAEKMDSILKKWQIPKEKVQCIVRDAGANIKKGVSLLHVQHVDCSSHQIQLIVKEGLKAQETVVTVLTKCKKMATHFHHSNTAQGNLSTLQQRLDQPKLKILQECNTRWNSTFYMLERILKNKDSLCLYASSNNKIPQLTSQEWIIVEKLICLLKPFEEITKELSASSVSISSVIPLIATLQKVMDGFELSDEHVGDTINVLKQELIRRFSHLETELLFSTATFIDPRYKAKFFKINSTQEHITNHIVDLIADHEVIAPLRSSSPKAKRARLNDGVDNLGSSAFQSMRRASLRDTMISLMDSSSESEGEGEITSDQSPPANALHLLVRKTITEYLSEKRLEKDNDPLMWWKVNEIKYELLSPVARQYLVTPPTSVPSERFFSGAGLIYTAHRNRLQGEKASKLLFLKYNIPLLQFDY